LSKQSLYPNLHLEQNLHPGFQFHFQKQQEGRLSDDINSSSRNKRVSCSIQAATQACEHKLHFIIILGLLDKKQRFLKHGLSTFANHKFADRQFLSIIFSFQMCCELPKTPKLMSNLCCHLEGLSQSLLIPPLHDRLSF